MATILIPQEEAIQKVILRNVSWQLYEHLLAEHVDVCNPRFAYDRGSLEIMVIPFEHEELNRLVADLFTTIADEAGIDFINGGSTTFTREDLEKGIEPDTCFYIRNAERVRGKKRIDLAEDPPPDLVIEIDITHPSLDKFPIFADLGVPEVWRYEGQSLTIFKLEGESYIAQASSGVLPGVTCDGLTELISNSRQTKRTAWLRGVREWARTLRSGRQ